jgi:hypothetical protein
MGYLSFGHEMGKMLRFLIVNQAPDVVNLKADSRKPTQLSRDASGFALRRPGRAAAHIPTMASDHHL